MVATSLVLVAALLHATWNTLIKFSGERLLVIASMDTVALIQNINCILNFSNP